MKRKLYKRTPLSEILHLYGIGGIHPMLELIPEASDAEFQFICADVEAKGFLHSVKIISTGIRTTENLLIDGRCRLQVGWAIQLDPPIERRSPKDVLGYVISQNVVRHHYTEEQRAMIAARLVERGGRK
jgi:hypothetical protein